MLGDRNYFLPLEAWHDVSTHAACRVVFPAARKGVSPTESEWDQQHKEDKMF